MDVVCDAAGPRFISLFQLTSVPVPLEDELETNRVANRDRSRRQLHDCVRNRKFTVLFELGLLI